MYLNELYIKQMIENGEITLEEIKNLIKQIKLEDALYRESIGYDYIENQFKAVVGISIEDFIKIYKEGFIKLDCKDDIIRSIQVHGIDKVMEIWGNRYGKIF